jgi:hypothetical protein
MADTETLQDIKTYFKNLKEWKIPLDWVFGFYLPCGCDYDKFREYGISNYKDLNNDNKYTHFINTYITKNYKSIAECIRHCYRFTKDNIVYKRTFTNDEGITRPYLVDVLYSDRLDHIQSDAIYYFAIEKFGRFPNPKETRSEQQDRLHKEKADHKDLEGLYEIEEIVGYTFED